MREAHELHPGTMHVVDVGARLIINFPTKRHWRAKSKLPDIEIGLQDLVRVLNERSRFVCSKASTLTLYRRHLDGTAGGRDRSDVGANGT